MTLIDRYIVRVFTLAVAVGLALIMPAPPASAADLEEALRLAQASGRTQVIVRLKQKAAKRGERPASVSEQRDAVASALSSVSPTLDQLGIPVETSFETLPYVGTTVDSKQLLALLESGAVDGVFLNHVERKAQTSALDIEHAQLAASVPSIDVADAWAKGFDGRGTTIAVIDGGFRTSHPMLAGRVITEACFSPNDPTFDTYTRCPSGQTPEIGAGAASNCPAGTRCDHGTHVASIAMGNDGKNFGVAREAKLLPIDVFAEVRSAADCSPDATPCELTDTLTVLKALDYVNQVVAQYNIVAVNLSLGGKLFEGACDTEPRREVVDMLRAKGVATIVSSGNGGQSAKITAPACIPSAIAVGSTNSQTAIAPSSNLSPSIDVVAPGVGITAASGQSDGLVQMSGTSMAAPHVAGAFAIIRSALPSKTVEEAEQALKLTGLKATRDNVTFVPKIQVNKAIARLQGRGIHNFNNVLSGNRATTLGQAFLRFQNDSAANGNVTVSMRDADTGLVVGTWTSAVIAPHASVQYDIAELERDARASVAGPITNGARKFYNLEVESTVAGYMQHIVWARDAGVLTNLTACSEGLSGDTQTLVNVHSRNIEGYPSRIRIVNTGVIPSAATLTFYNAADGHLLGTYRTPVVAANGSIELPVAAIEASVPALLDPVVAGVNAVYQYNVSLSGFTGYVQHIVQNTYNALLLDMSAKCDMGVR
jgi:subtilisin family serine protease